MNDETAQCSYHMTISCDNEQVSRFVVVVNILVCIFNWNKLKKNTKTGKNPILDMVINKHFIVNFQKLYDMLKY